MSDRKAPATAAGRFMLGFIDRLGDAYNFEVDLKEATKAILKIEAEASVLAAPLTAEALAAVIFPLVTDSFVDVPSERDAVSKTWELARAIADSLPAALAAPQPDEALRDAVPAPLMAEGGLCDTACCDYGERRHIHGLVARSAKEEG